MEQIKPLREMTVKERIEYIWDYYKVTFLVIFLCVFFFGGLLLQYFSYREPVMELMMVNAYQFDTTDLEADFGDFLTENGYDAQKDSISINSTINLDVRSGNDYDDQTTMQTLVATGTYSGFFSDESVFEFYAPAGYFRDLSLLLTDDELALLSDCLVYGRTEDDTTEYPCGLILDSSNCSWLSKTNYDSCYFGILKGNLSDELSAAFLRYIIDII
ncbi:MAG: hypothetical protein ACI4F0_07850 [Agathobacter sp.]